MQNWKATDLRLGLKSTRGTLNNVSFHIARAKTNKDNNLIVLINSASTQDTALFKALILQEKNVDCSVVQRILLT